jgi:hydroxyacylglutathione hydrolase
MIKYPVQGGVKMIFEKLEVGPLGTNCYIAGDETTKQGIIIDPGDEPGTIMAAVSRLGLKIETIVLTHGHPDHTAALADVKKETGAKIAIHADDADILKDRMLSAFLGMPHKAMPLPDRLLEDGDIISTGRLNFTVIHTPGHTPGGICLYGEGVLFSGDTLFQEGIGRADLGGDYDELINSIRRKLMTLDDKIVVYPGHGPQTTIGYERRRNPFLK